MKRIFLTGASTGIGRELAEVLTRAGHQVWGTSRQTERLPTHENFHPVELDLMDPVSIRAGFEAVLSESAGIDVLINNAGSGIFGAIEHIDDVQMRQQFQVLVFGHYDLIRRVLPGMRLRGYGVIVNVSSLAGEFPIPFMGPYGAAKAALSALTWCLDMELTGEPIRVIDLRPGDIRTGFIDRTERLPPDTQNAYLEVLDRAFAVYESNMRSAPPPARVASTVLGIIERDGRGSTRINSGAKFQTLLAPFFKRLLPHSWIRFGVQRYYNLK